MSTRDVIVRAALQLFSGPGAATVEELLQAAGVARRTFYKYFRNKEEVLTAVYELVTRELTTHIAEGQQGGDPVRALRTAFDVYLSFHVENHKLLRVLVEQAIRSDSPLAPVRLQFRAVLVALLDHAVYASTERRLEPYVFLHFISGIEGLSLDLLAAEPIDLVAVERARTVTNALLDALMAAAAQLPRAKPRAPGTVAARPDPAT